MGIPKHIKEHKMLGLQALKKGTIRISTAGGVKHYQAVADGSADDRAILVSALDSAVANLPATVELGPGDYGIQSGIITTMLQADKGLNIVGSGKNVTRIVMTGSGGFESTGRWHCFKFTPSVAPTVNDLSNYLHDINISGIGFYDDDPVGHASALAQTGSINTGTNTLTMSALNASMSNGSYVRVSGAGAAGAHLVTSIASGGGTVNIVLTDNAGTTVSNAVVYGIESGVSEETHGVNLQYGANCHVKDCSFDSIGDECVEFDYCVNSSIIGNDSWNSPFSELSGGGVFTIKNGSENCIVSDNIVDNDTTIAKGANTHGINIKVIQTETIKNILVTGNVIRNCVKSGINFGHSAAILCENITFSNNLIDNCTTGIARTGGNIAQFTNVLNNTITNCVDGIDFDVSLTQNLDCIVSYNTIDSISDRGILCNGTRLNLSGNNISNCTNEAIYVVSALDVQVSGGIIYNCGGTGIACVRANADGKKVVLNDVKILSANSTTFCILNVEEVHGCTVEQDAPDYRQVFSAQKVIDCTLDGGVVLDGAVVNGAIIGNTIDAGGADIGGTAVVIASSNNTARVQNNYINTTNGTQRTGIVVGGTSANSVVTGNIVVTDNGTGGISGTGTGGIVGNNQDI